MKKPNLAALNLPAWIVLYLVIGACFATYRQKVLETSMLPGNANAATDFAKTTVLWPQMMLTGNYSI